MFNLTVQAMVINFLMVLIHYYDDGFWDFHVSGSSLHKYPPNGVGLYETVATIAEFEDEYVRDSEDYKRSIKFFNEKELKYYVFNLKWVIATIFEDGFIKLKLAFKI